MVLEREDVDGVRSVDQRVLVELVAPFVDDVVDAGEVPDPLLVGASDFAESRLVDSHLAGRLLDSLIVERRQRVAY